MEPNYTWIRIGNHDATTTPSLDWYVKRQNVPHIIDIMGAPIINPIEFEGYIKRWIQSDTKLCISGELKEYGDGCPASNYRYKIDNKVNDNVISNYYNIFYHYRNKTYNRPVYVTTIPREWRIYSWYINETGEFILSNKLENVESTPINKCIIKPVIEDMLKSFAIDKDNLVKLRESCKGAKYNTYLIDMISFLYQVKMCSGVSHDIFSAEYRKINHVKGGQNVDKWTPEPETNYMYFDKTTENGTVFFTPTKESIYEIYKDFEQAINPYENDIKKSIRNHLLENRIDRWTDFDANDIDDALTILMLMHAFRGKIIVLPPNMSADHEAPAANYSDSMTEDEKVIYESLDKFMKPWIAQLSSL